MIFDYIFCGYGLSALLVLDRLALDGILEDKSVLIIDSGDRTDKTWCFWEENPGHYDEITSKQWPEATVCSDLEIEILRGRYHYKMIRPELLAQKVSSRLARIKGVQFVSAIVTDITDSTESVRVATDSETYIARKVFSGIPPQLKNTNRYPVLLQHFLGWEIETDKPCFMPDSATFMDFTIPQSGNTRFVYVLPFSATNALVEYTLFSPSVLSAEEYESGLTDYLRQKKIVNYKIVRRESGIIPMTGYPFWKHNTPNILHIGTAGGWTKASSGYTFMHAQKWAGQISEFMKSGDVDFLRLRHFDRFKWYDRILVAVLYTENHQGKRIFTSLFRKANPTLVLRFLREESSFSEDLKILAACPKRLFLKHLLLSFYKRFF